MHYEQKNFEHFWVKLQSPTMAEYGKERSQIKSFFGMLLLQSCPLLKE